jgi:hypothetical protein
MDGAIRAASTIMRVKSDVEKLGNDLQATAQKGTDMLVDLNIIDDVWKSLKGEVNKNLSEINTSRNQIVKDLEAVRQLQGALVDDAAKQLQKENEESLDAHYQSAEESKKAAENAMAAKESCRVLATKLEQLLKSVRNVYENDFSSKYKTLFDVVEKHAEAIHRATENKIDTFQQEIATKLEEFHNHMKEDVDRQLTDFLAKQNILVQNFGQQVDGLQRSVTARKVELEQMNNKILDIERKFEDSKTWFSQHLNRQDAEIAKLRERDTEVTKLKDRLERTLECLQQTSLIGRKFSGI